jgi:hypothetical protein
VEPIGEMCRRNRLRWFGNVDRKEDDDWVKRCTRMEVVGKISRGRPGKTWMSTLKDNMKKGALSPEDARDRDLWRRSIQLSPRKTERQTGKIRKSISNPKYSNNFKLNQTFKPIISSVSLTSKPCLSARKLTISGQSFFENACTEVL